MPRIGEFNDLTGRPPARRQLSEALRALLAQSGLTVKQCADLASCSKSAVGRYLSAASAQPDDRIIAAIRAAMAKEIDKPAFTLDQLYSLAEAVRQETRSAAAARRRQAVRTLPVPAGRGDRQRKAIIEPIPPWAAELAASLASSDQVSAVTVMRHAGKFAPAADTAAAIEACRDLDLAEIVETILEFAAERPHSEVIEVLLALDGYGDSQSMTFLLKTASRRTSQ